MRLRSGRVIGHDCAPARRAKRGRPKRPARAKKTTVRAIVNRAIVGAQEKKRNEISRTSVATKRTFNFYLCGSEIQYGALSHNRVGDNLTMTRFTVKYVASTTSVALPTATDRNAPIHLYMFIVHTTRATQPSSYWFQGFNTDDNVAFGNAPLTATGDRTRITSKLNVRDYKILARKKVILGGRTTADADYCAVRAGQFTTKKLNIKYHYNTLAASGIPYSADQTRPNIYLVWYALQPDDLTGVDSSDVKVDLILSQYYRE